MAITLDGFETLARQAVRHYWRTLEGQHKKQSAKDADRGGRSAVTGGKQMMGFCSLVQNVLMKNGVPDVHVFTTAGLELPGYFRPTKKWDMLVVSEGQLIAALEFKSQKGPSFGNNFNNRTEEAIGTAQDLWTAYRERAFGVQPRPWLGWLMLLEDCTKSNVPVAVGEPHFKVFKEFRGASYSKRYELLLRRLMLEKLFDGAAFLTATSVGGPRGSYSEPAEDLGLRPFLAGLTGHALGIKAGHP